MISGKPGRRLFVMSTRIEVLVIMVFFIFFSSCYGHISLLFVFIMFHTNSSINHTQLHHESPDYIRCIFLQCFLQISQMNWLLGSFCQPAQWPAQKLWFLSPGLSHLPSISLTEILSSLVYSQHLNWLDINSCFTQTTHAKCRNIEDMIDMLLEFIQTNNKKKTIMCK